MFKVIFCFLHLICVAAFLARGDLKMEKNSRDWDSFSRELDRISLWSKKDNSTKDGHQESSPTGLHTFFLSLVCFLLLCSSWSPPMPLCLRRLVSESALMATYGHTHSPRWPSPVFPSSAPPPLTWVHPHLLNYSVEFKQNIPGIWGTTVKGKGKVCIWKNISDY